LLPRFDRLWPSVPGQSGAETVDDEVVEDELVVVLCEMITIDGREGSEDCDVTIEVLGLDVVTDDNICGVMLELLEMTELLEVLVLDVGLMVIVGTGVDETTIVETELVLEVTGVDRDELVELVVETTVDDDVLTSAQSVETQ
jgi:hypothetical protein